MRILQLCKKFPYPLKDGESIAVNNLSKSLHELGCEVTLLAMNTRKHFFDTRQISGKLKHYRNVHSTIVDNRIKPWDAFLNLFSKESYHISRFVSPAFHSALVRLLKEQEFDLVQLETLYLAPYIPVIKEHSDALIAMRAHNVEHEIWDRITANTRSWLKKQYLKHLTHKLKRFELEQFSHYDILAAITQRDLDSLRDLGYRKAGIVTPIGIDVHQYRPDYRSFRRELSIGFIGSLDWMPNIEGLDWFLREVWPQLRRQFPALKLHIAGRNTPDRLRNMADKHIVVHGEVPDAANFINQHSVLVVPLLSGSGMRVKILEGMALGKVVLTTSLGLEGINARNQHEVLVANQPAEFVDALRYCYQRSNKLEEIGRKARDFVARDYDSQEIARRLMDTYSSLTVEVL